MIDVEHERIEWLARKLGEAHTAAYLQEFPTHDGAAELLAAAPELRDTRQRYLETIARRLLREGVVLPEALRPQTSNVVRTRAVVTSPDAGGGLFG